MAKKDQKKRLETLEAEIKEIKLDIKSLLGSVSWLEEKVDLMENGEEEGG